MSTSRHSIDPSLRRHILIGFLAVAALIGGIGAWAASTEIYGAVIASGFLVVESSVKKVQHPTGGVVGELFVRDGDHVKAGEVVMRLDATQTKANLGIVVKTIDELMARGRGLRPRRSALKPSISRPILWRARMTILLRNFWTARQSSSSCAGMRGKARSRN